MSNEMQPVRDALIAGEESGTPESLDFDEFVAAKKARGVYGMTNGLDEVRRAAGATFPGEWKLLHDQPDGDNVVVAIEEDGSMPVLIAAFDRADDARFLIAARALMLAKDGPTHREAGEPKDAADRKRAVEWAERCGGNAESPAEAYLAGIRAERARQEGTK